MSYPSFVRAAPFLLLAACSAEPPAAGNAAAEMVVAGNTEAPATAPVAAPTPTPVPPAPDAPPANVTGDAGADETVGGDGSQIRLEPLQPKDAAGLDGELACGFTADGAKAPLFVSRANVGASERGFAKVRNGGVVETLAGTTQGGFGAMEKGTTFGGKGLTIRITRQARLDTGDESSAYRAQLLAQRGDGAERRYAGLWRCGP